MNTGGRAEYDDANVLLELYPNDYIILNEVIFNGGVRFALEHPPEDRSDGLHIKKVSMAIDKKNPNGKYQRPFRFIGDLKSHNDVALPDGNGRVKFWLQWRSPMKLWGTALVESSYNNRTRLVKVEFNCVSRITYSKPYLIVSYP